MVRVGKLGRYRTIGHSACAIFVLLSMGLLVSCNSATVGSNEGSQLDVMDKVRSLDLMPRQSQPVDDGTAASGRSKSGSRPAMYEGTDVTAVSDERPQPAANGKSFDLNFENTPGYDCRQSGARRYPRRRLHDRSARTGNRQPGLGTAGRQIRHRLRAGKCPAFERRRADPRYCGLSPDTAGRCRGRRACRRSGLQPRTRFRRVGGATAACVGTNAVEADGQLRHQGGYGSRRRDAKPLAHSGHRRGTPHRRRHCAKLRCRLDAWAIGRRFSGYERTAGSDHRGAGKDRGFPAKMVSARTSSSCSRSPASTPSWS